MAKKPASGWERQRVDEWAFSVAILGWDNERYWATSPAEWERIYDMWLRFHAPDKAREREASPEEYDALSAQLSTAFGGTVTSVPKE